MGLETVFKVPRMYGVEHGSCLDLAGIRIAEGKIYPSVGLMKNLFALPAGSKVGVETFDPREVKRLTYKMGSQRFGLSKAGKFYWQEIIDVCKIHGLNVVYLDNFKVYREYVAKIFEEQRCKEEIEKCREEETKPDPEKLRQLEEATYRANVEGKFLFEVKREEEIVKRIAKYKPEMVIIGRAHGDCLMAGGELLKKYGVCVGDYQREEVERDMWGADWADAYFLAGRIPGKVSVLHSPSHDPLILLDRELLLRKHRVLTEGQVTAFNGRLPDYIGTWDLDCPPRGYFELYINGKTDGGGQLLGTIEDCLGTADFEGEIDSKWTQFLKGYQEGRRAKEAVGSDVPILYEGNFQEGIYRGNFSFRQKVFGQWGDFKSNFVMLEGQNFSDLKNLL